MSEWNDALDAADAEMAKWLGPQHKARLGVRGLRRMNSFVYDNAGCALTEGFEGCELKAYQDIRGVWTIGYGHTGPNIGPGVVWTQGQCEAALIDDVGEAVACVNGSVVVTITQDEFDALVDFTFNVGRGHFLGSTLLRLLNEGDFAGAAGEFVKWTYAGGIKSNGLLRRREAEEELFVRAS